MQGGLVYLCCLNKLTFDSNFFVCSTNCYKLLASYQRTFNHTIPGSLSLASSSERKLKYIAALLYLCAFEPGVSFLTSHKELRGTPVMY